MSSMHFKVSVWKFTLPLMLGQLLTIGEQSEYHKGMEMLGGGKDIQLKEVGEMKTRFENMGGECELIEMKKW